MAQRKLKESITSALKSRKFILSILLVVGATLGLFTGDVTWGQWLNFSQIILAIYGVSNVGEHFSNSIKHKSDNEKKKKEIELQIEKQKT